jgi:hypothetical protein
MQSMLSRRVVLGVLASLASVALAPVIAIAETAVKPEVNPPGDIPDNQVFITYKSPLGVAIQVPEGWARMDKTDGVVFADKYGRIEVTVSEGMQLTPKEAADALKSSGRAVAIKKAETAKRPAGEAIFIAFDSNSEPNAVTNKQIRLENDRYVFSKNGKVATLTFSAPKGADNVDQWLLMSKSFQW